MKQDIRIGFNYIKEIADEGKTVGDVLSFEEQIKKELRIQAIINRARENEKNKGNG